FAWGLGLQLHGSESGVRGPIGGGQHVEGREGISPASGARGFRPDTVVEGAAYVIGRVQGVNRVYHRVRNTRESVEVADIGLCHFRVLLVGSGTKPRRIGTMQAKCQVSKAARICGISLLNYFRGSDRWVLVILPAIPMIARVCVRLARP